MKSKVLLLNGDFTPERLISWKTAIIQEYIHSKNSAYTVAYFDEWVVLDSYHRRYKVPAVMALRKYVSVGDYPCQYTKSNVYARDLMVCQYCHKDFPKFELTVDHIIPTSHWKKKNMCGYPSTFTNVVTACKRCNSVKGDKTLDESGMTLLKEPTKITRREVFRNRIKLMADVPTEWKPFLTGIISDS